MPMTMRADAVLFDLDDTLYPERQFVDGGFRAVARFISGMSDRSAEVLAARLRELHGRDGRGRLFDTLLDEVGLGGDLELVPACLLIYRTHPTDLEPFPGVLDLLTRLRAAGVRTGVVSDGNAAVQTRKLSGLGPVADAFDAVVLTDLLGPGYAKPSPVGFLVACRLLGVSPAATIYVGNDPRKDFGGARSVGMATIRIGPLPDEGGSAITEVDPASDADLAADSFGSLATMLAGQRHDR
jgi:putative hydrolase of the HAD superfamily